MESITNILYVPVVAGDRIVVDVPLAVVIVAPAVNVLVPDGANQTLLLAFSEETMVTSAPPVLEIEDANTVSWLLGAVLSTAITLLTPMDD